MLYNSDNGRIIRRLINSGGGGATRPLNTGDGVNMALAKRKTISEMEIMLVTPELAQEWLENTKFNNRHIVDRLVNKIARDIKSNKWVYDGNSIKFDKDDNLIDGQHRLWAILKSDMNVQCLIIRGLDDRAKNIIDTGKSRTNSDVLHFNGFINTASLANACRLAIGYRKNSGNLYDWAGGSAKANCSTSEILNEAQENTKLVSSLQDVISKKFTKKFMGIGTAAFCHYIFTKKDKLMADEFFYLLEKGIDLPEGHPVLALRNCLTLRDHLTSKLAKGGNYRSAYLIALVIKAWNVFRDGRRDIKRLKFGDDEQYPVPQ